MLVQGIKSRPVYKGVAVDPNAARNLFVLEGEGALALLEQSPSLDESILAKTEILYVAAASKPQEHGRKLASLGASDYWEAPTVPVLLNRLHVMLGTAKMGLRIYISGTEGFIGQAMQVALNHGVDFNSIPTEHRGSEARRVQCVHCKGHHRKRQDVSLYLQPLWPAASGARSLLAPHRRLSGRLHRRRRTW